MQQADTTTPAQRAAFSGFKFRSDLKGTGRRVPAIPWQARASPVSFWPGTGREMQYYAHCVLRSAELPAGTKNGINLQPGADRTIVAYPKNVNLWLPAYLRDRVRSVHRGKAKRLWVAITDHYEPLGGKVTMEVARARVGAWQRRWPSIALAAPKDADGRAPCYTFFYPQEEYSREILDALAEMSRTGLTDVEVHIHHDRDTPALFEEKIRRYCATLEDDHGLLHRRDGKLVFGFIHGNWALDNSRPDGMHCGVTGELQLLRDLGCYADFTMPSIPSATQSRVVNQIYWTTGDPARPRGFDRGVEASVGGGVQGDLLMICGPAGLRFRERLVPRIETGELAVYDRPTPARVKRWLDLAPRLGDDIFLKLFAHGAREDNAGALLGTGNEPGSLAPMFEWIHQAAREQELELHWASAYQMFCAADGWMKPAAPRTAPETANAHEASGMKAAR